MKLAVACITVLALGVAGTLNAQTQSVQEPALPNLNTVPVVLGEVTDVTSHSVMVKTTRGEAMSFETDSRTVMPTHLASGSRVKIEFHLMDNGSHHAGRVTVIETGSADWDRYQRELAAAPPPPYVEPTGTASSTATNTSADENSSTNAERTDRTANSTDPTTATHQTNQVAETSTDETRDDELPRTASRQPLLLGLGLAVATLGVGLALTRRRRTA